MRVTIEARDLVAAMRRVTTVMSRTTMPILACVHLEAEAGLDGNPGTLTFRATNMEHAMKIAVEAVVHEAGAVCVAADRLGKHFTPPEGSEVDMRLSGAQLTVKAGPRSMKLPVMDAADFPSLDAPKLKAKLQLDSGALQRLLDFTEYAEAREGGIAPIAACGIHLQSRDGKLAAMATDGKIMSEFVSDIPCPAEFGGITIPRAFIPGIRAALGGPVMIGHGEGRFVLFGAALTFVSRLLDAPFPDLSKHIRKDDPYRLGVAAKCLADALGRTIAFAGDETSTVYLTARGNDLLLHAESSAGSFDETVDIAGLEGVERLDIAMNGRMLKAICGVAGDAEMVITARANYSFEPVMISSPDIPSLFVMLASCASNESNYKHAA